MGRAAGVNLTKATIEALRPKARIYRIPDQQRGLELQVTPGGVISWVLRYRMNGRQKTYTIGRWPEVTVALARKMALDLLSGISQDADPAAKRKAERKAGTVAELVRQFKVEHLPTVRLSTAKEYTRLLDRRILPALGSMRAKDVSSADVAALLSKIRTTTRKGTEANRTRAVLSKMFNLSEVWGYRSDMKNPAKGQVTAPEVKRARHLSDRELLALGAALRHLEPGPPGEKRPEDAIREESIFALAAFRLLLFTGMRKSEVIGDRKREIPALTWDDVDLDEGIIRLERHKTSEDTGARIVILCAPAADLLEGLPRFLGNPHVLPGALSGESWVNLQSAWSRVRDAVDTLQEWGRVPKKARVSVQDVTIHDLRRSYASLAARMGYPELIVAALLGHKAGTVTQRYARLGIDPLRDVVEAIGERMAALLEGTVDLEAEAKETRAKHRARRAGNGSHHLA